MTDVEIEQTMEKLYLKGSNAKKIYSGPEYQNLDVYQINDSVF